MAKVTYKPDEGEPKTHAQYGIDWTAGKAVDVTDEAVLARVRNNRFYDVAEDEKSPAHAKK